LLRAGPLRGAPHRPAGSPAANIRLKVELRFEKGEAARFISHHDLMRAFQRAVRRAGLPVRLTEGFNPRPRLVFPVALEVGIASQDEAAELELTQWMPLNEIQERLSRSLPPGLNLRSIQELPPLRKGRQPVRIRYRLHLAEQGIRINPPALEALRTAPSLPFLRRTPNGDRRTADLKLNLVAAEAAPSGDLLLDLKPLPQGLARPLEYLSLLTERPLETLRHVRVTKLLMDLAFPQAPAPPPNR